MRKVKILKPSDFFCGIDFTKIKDIFHEMPFRTIAELIIHYSIALVTFLLYYVTIIFRIINEKAEAIAEWCL